MRSKLRTAALVAFCAAASLAASQCGPSRSSQPADEAPTPGRLEAHAWTPQSSPDSIAAWVLAGCRGRADKGDCVEKALISTIGPAGVDKSMAALLIVAAKDEDISRDGHVYAHGIGIAAYTSPETVGDAFGRCTTDFQSGCYHGVIQGYFADDAGGTGGVTAEKLNALCAPYRSPDKRWLDFQCAHGAGHGLMAVNAHHLLKSLDACDLLADHFEKQGCWGGAFMENVVNATNPHHTAVTQTAGHEHGGGHHGEAAPAQAAAHGEHGAGHGDHGGAGHGATASADAEPFKALDKNEPLYPCNVVKEHHRQQCYLMQTSAILFHSNGDFADASRQCGRAPEAMRQTCFQSLGRDANSWAGGSHERAIRYCGTAPEESQAYCIVGVVKNIVDVTAVATDGLEFCKQVPGHTKPACYRAVGQQIALLRPAHAARERECAAAESGYLTECRFGAGLGLLRTEE